MRSRCLNKNNKSYPEYGGKGITICSRWENFENFFADMGEPPTNKHSLDRINGKSNYYPENCRWATFSEQNQNREGYFPLSFMGQIKTQEEWSQHFGFEATTLGARLRRKRKKGLNTTFSQIVEAAYLEHQQKRKEHKNHENPTLRHRPHPTPPRGTCQTWQPPQRSDPLQRAR